MKVRFAEFTIDSETRQLLRDGRAVHLAPKAFAVLCTLIEQRPKVVDKDELQARIWPGTFVVDANLNVVIAEIRRALADSPQSPRFVRTIHGTGYAFCGEAADLTHPERPAAASPRFWLLWNERAIVLAEGDNIIGRDPQCSIWLDATGVSRRHARIQVPAAGNLVLLEDLGSKNGTILRGAAIDAAERVADGDVIQIGAVELKFRADKQAETERVRRRPG